MFSHFHGEKTVGAKTLLLNSTTFVRACKPEIVNLQDCKMYYVCICFTPYYLLLKTINWLRMD